MLSCVLCAHGCVCVTDKSDGWDEWVKKTKRITWSLGSAPARAITRSSLRRSLRVRTAMVRKGWWLAKNILLGAISGPCRTFYNAFAVAEVCV
ncbi:hypothetical protein BT102_01070 [Lacticaseibacillus rhamnosus]|uniref:Uncharacterized protein n=1 Tax=Lacticaseibacillus rhamnosus TaxID=47715 RepID=A0AAP8J290_LACRH|nr:hypothetical protein BT102_01070 [Lacticaseibacillus rhamnosus]PLA57441.1 hypothetical protein CYJ91_06485 [Lacticaseibacillus rhamnosus]PTM23764.1 hypothetical protein DA801_10750 [Lacticaseibacillus rhamnosus]TXK06785.1 hypothetical protein FU656_04890 [Lacticaseibacillus rhamnosus]